MATHTTLARPYAYAVLRAAGDDDLELWSRALALLAQVVEAPEAVPLLESPTLSARQKADVLMDILGDDLFEPGRNLLQILVENNRLLLLPAIREMFEEIKARHEQKIDIQLTCAFELDDAQSAEIKDSLGRHFKRQITLENKTDKSLIGGAIIRTGDVVIDASLRGRLDQLAKGLRAGT